MGTCPSLPGVIFLAEEPCDLIEMLNRSTREVTTPAVAFNKMMGGELLSKFYLLPHTSGGTMLSATVTEWSTVAPLGSFALLSHVPTPPPGLPGLVPQSKFLP